MEVNRKQADANAGGTWQFVRRAITVMLFVMMVFAMMPLMMPGVSTASAATKQMLLWPTPGFEHITDGRYFSSSHKGVDISGTNSKGKAIAGTNVIASCDGTIARIWKCSIVYKDKNGKVIKYPHADVMKDGSARCCYGYGWGIVVKGKDGRYYHYPHMQQNSIPSGLKKGSSVTRGQVLGKVGQTGYAIGEHLHYAMSTAELSGYFNPLSQSFENYSKNRKPIGDFTSCSCKNGKLTVKGWAFDPDNTDKAIEVHVYMDKTTNSPGTYIGKTIANQENKTANNQQKCGTKHGFSAVLDITKFKEGTHKIYIYAAGIDKTGKRAGSNGTLSNCPRNAKFTKGTTYSISTNDAANVTNTTATLSGTITPRCDVKSWGIYLGISEADMNKHKYQVSTKATSSANMKAQAENYMTLEAGKKYWYKVYADIGGEVKVASFKTFKTSAEKPDIPVLTIDPKSEEIGIGDSPIFKWARVSNTDYYKLYVYNENGDVVSVVDNIQGTTCSADAVQAAGEYTARLESYNSVGTRGKSDEVSFIVHPNVTVTFKDAATFVDVDSNYEAEVLGTCEVAWGHDADFPAKPSHNGYTFTGWSDEAKTVKKSVDVIAEYSINTYKVTFIDSKTGEKIGDPQMVEYYRDANPPEYTPDSGYAKVGYDGWDKDYHRITEDMTLYTCVGWERKDLPIVATITNAVREYDATSSEDEGYTVTLNLQNMSTSTTKGRAVIALKTSAGKLLTSTESAAFSIKSNATKQLEVFVPYTNAASIAEAFVIGQYKDAVPISPNVTFPIDQSNTMTSWSTEQPPAGASNVEQRKEYRYRDKQTTTSYNTSLAGYTQSGSNWVKQSGGTIDYVVSFPTGFNKSSAYYTKYNGVKPKTASETTTDKTTVSTSTVGYIYWHWCRGYTGGPINRLISDCKEGDYTHWHSFSQTNPITWDTSAKAFYSKRSDVCKDSYWWVSTYANKSTQLPIKRCTYNTYKKLFNYYKWTDWTDWSTTPATASDNKEVVTRTVYRYQVSGTMEEDNSGTPETVSGEVDSSFAGKEATLFVYKINEASDFTNEYVGQTVIGENGQYSFAFIPREDPSWDTTGEFTVALGIEGTTTPIFLDPIKPKNPKTHSEEPKKYHVTFLCPDGKTELCSEDVEEHGNATLPDENREELKVDGQTFVKWSDSNMNVTEDRILIPLYKKNIYTVVFVDWQANTVSMEKFEDGATLVPPHDPEEPPEGQTVEWDKIADGVTDVREDMIVSTRYKEKELDVTILNEDGTVDAVKPVTYGMAVELPEIKTTESDKKEFLGWEDISGDEPEGLSDTIMTTNAILCPVYSFNETVANPTADLAQGEYDSTQTVTLTCETPGADIYYTLDGSDPKELKSSLYTGPIEIDGPVELKFYACKFEMNDSDVQTRLYSVNYDGATSKYMLYEDLPQEVKDNESAYRVQYRTGYRYKDTQIATTLAEAASLEAEGWSLNTEADATYEPFSDWSDSMPANANEYINLDVETEPIYTTADQFTYSHYVYEDGITKYSPTEVSGFDCVYEELGPFEEPLYSAGKDANGNRMYSYDGQIWYNQTETSGQVQTGARYRWRAQKVPYTKWSDWTITKPGTGEQREYESSEVVNYIRPKSHIVTVHLDDETWAYLTDEGSKAQIYGLEDALDCYETLNAYTNSEFTNEWNLDEDIVTDSIDLYLKGEKKVFEIPFVDEDGNVLSLQSVVYGESAIPPEAPAVEGKRFVGWSCDEYENVTGCCDLIRAVYVPEDEYATVTLDEDPITIYKNETVELKASVSPVSKSDTELTWTSSNEDVAVVSDTGEVTGTGKGTADITVKVNETGETATCTVTVKVDNSDSLVLIKNDKLSIDAEGYLRGAKGNKDTVADIFEYFDNAGLACVNMAGETVEASDLFGTGYQVQLIGDNGVKDSIEAVVTGDFSGDGAINNKDVALLLRHLLDKVEPTKAQVRAGDVNGSGRVDARDAVLTLRVIVGKETLN